MKKIILYLVLFTGVLQAQSNDPDEILEKVKNKFNRVKDYVVDVKIKVDVEFLKVPVTNAKIYFKQPDKVHVESDKFALLPKEGLDFSPSSLLKYDYTSIYEKDIMHDGHKTSIIKIIPTGDQGDIILSTLWVDQKESVIRKVESTTKTAGTFTIDFSYGDSEYPLPSAMIFGFNLEKMDLPRSMSSEPDAPREKKNKGGNTQGKVFIHYSNYSINKGIADSIFEEKKKQN